MLREQAAAANSIGSGDSPHDRLMTALRWAAPTVIDTPEHPLRHVPLAEPVRMQTILRQQLAGHVCQALVTGTLDRRLLLIQRDDSSWVVADLAGRAHKTRAWPNWTDGHIILKHPDSWLSRATLDDEALHRIRRPRVLVAALYRPQHFPLPRFALGISDLARAARATLMGQTSLLDMQLGASLDSLAETVANEQPDILGVSATFGQHDLMIRLLDAVRTLSPPPLVIAGGSLVARNEGLLLDRYPELLIARGAGERTMQDMLAYWHGDLGREQIRGVAYVGTPHSERTSVTIGPPSRHTPVLPNRQQDDILPELDLLERTLRHKGVAQLEASRGCTNYCSFCPRSHKGLWSGATADGLSWMLDEMNQIFKLHPNISRTIYLVDEEFIGRAPDADRRALDIAETLHTAGFRWETSCRIDQVVRRDRDLGWHATRATLWRQLCSLGLRRCLFGVESGVDSILERFNKETTAEQNALAIRTLSALGVPTRFTYITFDHLMTEAELRESCAFLGRTDLILRPLMHLGVDEVVRGVRDPAFVAAHSLGRPFYSAVSYPLVSMECLLGAAYTRKVQAAGLAGPLRPSMGRRDAKFADWRIGRCSYWAQLWVDRSFSLDYTLKSLEKITEGRPYEAVRAARAVLKEAAYSVLRQMLETIAGFSESPTVAQTQALHTLLLRNLDSQFAELVSRMASVVDKAGAELPSDTADLLHRELRLWRANKEWALINPADALGT